jgi:hypothetical protein
MATVRLQLRRGLADDWFDANPTLAAGEIGIETDTNTFKFGDGDTPWNDLEYALSGTVDDYIELSTKGVAGGVASLDSSGLIPLAQLPGAAALDAEVDAAVTNHNNATTSVHGIANTSLLATTSNVATAKSEAIAAAEDYVDAAIGVLTNASPDSLNTLNELAAALGDDANFASTVTNSLAAKAPLDSPLFTGTVTLPESTNIGNVNSVEIGYVNGVTSNIQNQIDDKAPLESPTLTGTVTLPESTSIGNVSNLEIGYLGGVTSSIQTQIDDKLEISTAASTYATLASPTLTGTVTLPESTSIGNVGNLEIGYLDGVTSSIQTQIDDKLEISTAASTYSPLESPTFTGTVTLPGSTSIGDVSNLEIGYLNGVTSGVQTQLDAKAPLESPTFTGTVTLPANTISQSMMGDDSVGTNEIVGFAVTEAKLAVNSVTEAKIADGSVTSAKIADGTIVNADINASAAIAQSKIDGLGAALDLKAPLADPTFTGTVSGITKTMVGLDEVDNTSDADKPISTATQDALDLKAPIAAPSFTGDANFESNVTIEGNLIVEGTTTTVNTSEVQIDDPLFYLAANQYDANTRDIGITGAYGTVGGTEQDHLHTGLVKDVTDGKWKLFSNTPHPVNNVVDFTSASYDTLKLGSLEATTVTPSSGVVFSDGTQTKYAVPSLTVIGTEISADYNLSTGGLGLRDQLIPIAGTRAITIPTNATLAFPIGGSIDFYQSSGTGANFVAADGTVTILRTPGLKLRTTHSSATLTKVAINTWLLAGDLTA